MADEELIQEPEEEKKRLPEAIKSSIETRSAKSISLPLEFGALGEEAYRIAERTDSWEELERLEEKISLESPDRVDVFGAKWIHSFINKNLRSLEEEKRREHKLGLEEAREAREQAKEEKEAREDKRKKAKEADDARKKAIAARPKREPYFKPVPSSGVITGTIPRSQYRTNVRRSDMDLSRLKDLGRLRPLVRPTAATQPEAVPTFLTRQRVESTRQVPIQLEPGEEIVREEPDVLFWIGSKQGMELGLPGTVFITRTRNGTYRFVGIGSRTHQQRSKMIGKDIDNAYEVAMKMRGKYYGR